MNMQLSKTEIAIANSKTVFGATVKSVSDGLGKTEKIIKKSTNIKLGKKVTKGKFNGFPIFTVTLQERATCPTDCIHWSNCYGNNMPFATRYTLDKQAIELMESELTELQRKYPNGFLVRLHILGDFFSLAYVEQWNKWLRQFSALHVYGYTANLPNSKITLYRKIANAIIDIRNEYKERFAVRFSGYNDSDKMTALSYDDEIAVKMVQDKKAFICPVQENKTDSCGTCTACWASFKPVVFITH